MIIELMLLLIVLGVGILVVAWSNTRRRKQDALERREVEDSTGKLKQELERTANEIIGRMENHVNHLENVLDESERNRMQLEGRVTELKKLLKKSEGQSGEIRDLLARLDDAGAEVSIPTARNNPADNAVARPADYHAADKSRTDSSEKYCAARADDNANKCCSR